jgi:16S rRNA (guanine966-N2)-methyltransferase
VTRIIAGEFGGRRLAVPRGGRVRPTTDRVREAWMSILGPELPGARVVDLFAGTGALGLEALSRGAEAVVFVERTPQVLTLLRRNIESLGVGERTRVVRGDALRYADGLDGHAFDLALADPPYTGDYAERLIRRFRDRPFARILALEHRATLALPGDGTRRYGDSAITFCHAR